MNRFLDSVADILEVSELTLDTPFRETSGWCSLQGFGLIVMMQEAWRAPIALDDFASYRTVRDLFREAFLALAAGVFGVDRAALSGATAYQSIPQWDSVNHLRLVMEAEKAFGVQYPLDRIPSLRTLDDFLR